MPMASVHRELVRTASYPFETNASASSGALSYDHDDEEKPAIKSPKGHLERGMLFGKGAPRDRRLRRSSSNASARDGLTGNGGCEDGTVEELEQYAVHKSEETTATVNNCLKVAEEIGQDAAKMLVDLHQQGEQIRRSHSVAVDIDRDLSAGEKILGSLGGIFSKTWRPKKTRSINGPLNIQDDSIQNRGTDLQQSQTVGLVRRLKSKVHKHIYPSGGEAIEAHIQTQKVKQDNALSDLSNMLDKLKDMAVDMGQEIGRQNKALDNFDDDVAELGFRVKGANARGRRLLGK